ncbi:MAG: SET domain-containing protein-lysine N-methyltransferase [Verrucomicrobia bacterium]|nr:SET domain-containing protein-lysine N-methyltransferase [Verrucomicrobiota bacterium]
MKCKRKEEKKEDFTHDHIMVLVQIKDTSEIQELSIADFEKKMDIRWLDHLEFRNDQIAAKVLRKSQIALKRKELSMRENWIGTYFRKEISRSFSPPVSVRWINDQMGYGVFAQSDIAAGAFIGEYTGTVRRRKWLSDKRNDYCFEYTIGDWVYNPFIIDAMGQGNFTRFINHSDTPNLEPLSVYADGVMHIVFVAQKPIQKGCQLSYHYGDHFWKKRKGPCTDLYTGPKN